MFNKNSNNKSEFSKFLLKQESALIWIMSLSFIILAFYCIHAGFTGSLPWLAAMVGFPWTAYGVSQAMYYRKSMRENTCGGIKYDTVMEEIRKAKELYEDGDTFDFDVFEESVSEAMIHEMDENVDEYQI